MLSDEQLAKMFDLQATLNRLRDDEQKMMQECQIEEESAFRDATARFKI